MSYQRARMPDEKDIMGTQCADWFVIGVDDGTVEAAVGLEDRLTMTQAFIKSRQTVDLEENR